MAESDSNQKPEQKTNIPGVENVPTFDELPPAGYESARKEAIEKLCREHNMTPEDVERFEKMAEEESQEQK